MAIVRAFSIHGGRVLRLDGGGEPLEHPAIREGSLLDLSGSLGLKATILTSGDLLGVANLPAIARAECYVRVSLNSATERTRKALHGQASSLDGVLRSIEKLVATLAKAGTDTPVGATFMLIPENFPEIALAAERARDAGVSHFSVRRVLGPPWLRPQFTESQCEQAAQLLSKVRSMDSEAFRVFVPWRPLAEPDVSPASGALAAATCWQAALKCVIEPDPQSGGLQVQSCGRYRGGGIGQLQQREPLARPEVPGEWVVAWHGAVKSASSIRDSLQTCRSCIDRGFILLVDRILGFLGVPPKRFRVLHLHADDPEVIVQWQTDPALHVTHDGLESG
jgi:hypothetical protein